ncbi:uncharacterized protein LOC135385262 [Ornithodoros turicata]|uniref:uncharacterized protein LOC135385262 n=1 Tax=Ornithodoros turicata TaxID=34597 RepID=UPI003138C793
MVERLHRQLKAAICARPDPTNWVDHLPWVLLGLRSSLKQDLTCSSAELVFGCPLRLPGDFLEPPSRHPPAGDDFARQLRDHFRTIQPAPPRQPLYRRIFVHPDLNKSSHVFIRADHVKPPLTPVYTGPYQVLSRDDKTVTVDINGHRTAVSQDRLKPAYVEAITYPAQLPVLPTRHKGRPPNRPRQNAVSWSSPLVTHQCLGGEPCSAAI